MYKYKKISIISHQDEDTYSFLKSCNKNFIKNIDSVFLSSDVEKTSSLEKFTNLEKIPNPLANGFDISLFKFNDGNSKDSFESFSKCKKTFDKMLSFASYNQSCFTKKENEDLYKQTLSFILFFLNNKKPDLIINMHIPHNFFEVMLAEICEIKHIDHIYLRHFGIPNIYILQNSLYKNDRSFLNKFNKKLSNKLIFKNIKKNIHFFRTDNLNIKPKNNKWQNNSLLFYYKKNFPFFYFTRFIVYLKNALKIFIKTIYLLVFYGKKKSIYYFFLQVDKIKKIKTNYLKNKTSRFFLNYVNFYSDIYKFKLIEKYRSLSVEPDYNEKFIYYPLWYQPSASSYPFARNFLDNISAIKILSNNNKNLKIYIKEHEDIFNLSRHAWVKGAHVRTENFYKALLKIPNVKLINILESDSNLISNSFAVATLPTKMLFLAIAKRKPVILFGHSPLSSLNCVFSFDNNFTINYLLDKIVKFNFNKIEIKIKKFLLQMTKICIITDAMNSFEKINVKKDYSLMAKIIMHYCIK
jgi:hypothetical protein